MYDNYERAHAAITAVTQCFHAPTAVQDAMRALGYPAEQAFEISKRVHGDEPADVRRRHARRSPRRASVDIGEPARPALLAALARLRRTGAPALDARRRIRALGGAARQLSARRADDDGAHDRPVRQGRSRHDRRAEVRLSRTRRAGDGAHRVRRDRAAHRQAAEDVRLPMDDAKTYDLIQRGETIGTFQIESRAQINSILHTKPDHLYDIVVQVALIRPGPIQATFVHPYTERRLGQEPVTYPRIPISRRSSQRTQGIPIFQEQAMAIAMKLGGYTGDAGRRCCGGRWATSGRRAGSRRRSTTSRSAMLAARRRRDRSERGDGDADLRGPRELRELWISRIARVELRADRVRDGVSQGALSDGVLHRRCSTRSRWGSIPSRRWCTTRSGIGVEVRPPCLRAWQLGMHGREWRDAHRLASSCAASATR